MFWIFFCSLKKNLRLWISFHFILTATFLYNESKLALNKIIVCSTYSTSKQQYSRCTVEMRWHYVHDVELKPKDNWIWFCIIFFSLFVFGILNRIDEFILWSSLYMLNAKCRHSALELCVSREQFFISIFNRTIWSRTYYIIKILVEINAREKLWGNEWEFIWNFPIFIWHIQQLNIVNCVHRVIWTKWRCFKCLATSNKYLFLWNCLESQIERD